MSNEEYIKTLVNKYPNFQGLSCHYDTLTLDDQKIVISSLILEQIISGNEYLNSRLPMLRPQELFDIITCYTYLPKISSENPETNLDIQIKSMRALTRVEGGIVKNYLYYMDEYDVPHLTQNENAFLVANNYQTITSTYQNYPTMKQLVKDIPSFINLDEYQFYLTKQELLTDEERLRVYNFEKMMFTLYQNQKYLNHSLHTFIQKYLDLINQLEVKSDKSIEAIDALARFHELQNNSKEEKDKSFQRQLKPVSNKEGYLNGIVLIVIVCGVGLALAILFLLNK